MKPSRDMLTNEKIKRRYASQFDLVNHAIQLAEEIIATGRAPRCKSDAQNNLALLILEEIASGPGPFEDKGNGSAS
jgi:hypothetical protein